MVNAGSKVCVSMQSLYMSLGGAEKGFIVPDYDDGGNLAYFDLYDEGGNLACMDGEACVVEATDEEGVVLANGNGEQMARFRLSWSEFEACCG